MRVERMDTTDLLNSAIAMMGNRDRPEAVKRLRALADAIERGENLPTDVVVQI